MDVAGEAQTLAAALNHSAFNAGQRARRLAGWRGDQRRPGLDVDRLGRRAAGDRGLGVFALALRAERQRTAPPPAS
jgi:DHA1 family inner membrane transport protein